MRRKISLLFLLTLLLVSCQEEIIQVESVELNQGELILDIGETSKLVAHVYPSEAQNKNITWHTRNSAIATIEDGYVTGMSEGSTIVYVKTEDGGFTSECKITVEREEVRPERITLDAEALSLTCGDEYTLSATIYPENTTDKTINWSSSNKEVATVVDGKITALKAGTATIRAITYMEGLEARCIVTVTEKVYHVESVVLDKTSHEMTEGDELTLIATVNPENATNKNVTWTSNNEEVATVKDGKVTALKAGKATITVTTEDGGKTATCEITANEKIYPVTGITLNKASHEMTEGDEVTLIATVNPENASNKNVTWTSNNKEVATVKDGKVTAIKAGTATITATTEDGGKTATCEVTVSAKVYSVTGVTLNKTSHEMTEGDVTTLIATINPENATNKNVTWTSNNEEVATVKDGKVTALKAGKATITVTTEDGGKTATCEITINEKIYPVTGITLNKASHEMTEGDEVTLIATVNPENASNKNVTWTSNNKEVATVKDGKVTAVKAGTATITVTTEDGGKTATCEITVNEKIYPVTGVTLNKTSHEMTEGDELTLIATVNPENATNKNVTWTSNNKEVATVKDGKITAVKAGTATITVTTEDGGKTATCEITVNEKTYPVTGVTLNETSHEMTEGDELTLIATVNPENATNKNVTWTSDNEEVATVEDGKVTAIKAGTATITVTTEDGGKTATCKVTVTAKVYHVTGVTLDRSEHEMTEGDKITLTATITPDNATNKNVTWKTSDASVATVADGKITAVKAGTAIITVTTEDGNKTATCEVTVLTKLVPVSKVLLNKISATLQEGGSLTLTPTIYPSNATNKTVVWSSKNTDIATVDNGKVTAVSVGETTIKVTTEDGNKTATCTITVTEKTVSVTSVSLSKTKYEMTEGDEFTLTATITPDNATNKNVTWKTSDASVATVSEGKVTALKAGTATITVTTENGKKTATCEVTVNEKVYPVTGVTLDNTEYEMTEGDEFTLTATVAPENATNKNVTWKTSDASVATVSNGKVTALKEGTATITVTTDDGNKTATCKVTVKKNVNHTTTEPVEENNGIWTENIDYVDEYGINHGHGVKIGSVVWAPVNCGYHANNHKYGKLYQWGRKYGQGYDGDATTTTLSNKKVSETEGNLEKNANIFYYGSQNWVDPHNKYSWNNGTESSPVKTSSDPCPDGWRVPTSTELNELSQNHSHWTTNDADQIGYWFSGEMPYSEDVPQIFFPAAGLRYWRDGEAISRGTGGYYWSSSPHPQSNYDAYVLFLNDTYDTNMSTSTSTRAYGFSVRCVQE